MNYLVLFGPPGAGKGTQSDNIINKYGFAHISTGDVLRAEMKNGTELGKTAKGYIEAGKLVPDDLIVDMLAKSMDEQKDAKGIIFDGFPRTVAQAKALKQMLAKRGTDVTEMINLQVDDEELIARLVNRGKTSGRTDDNLETIKKRLDTYNNETAPVIDFYEQDGKLCNVKGTGSVEEIFERICQIIDKH